MIFELVQSEFRRIRAIFSGHYQYLPVMSIVNQNYPGRVFVNNMPNPQTALGRETTEGNIASRRLAQKLGFIEGEKYPVYAIEF